MEIILKLGKLLNKIFIKNIGESLIDYYLKLYDVLSLINEMEVTCDFFI